MIGRRRPGVLVAQLGLVLALVVGIFYSFQSNVFQRSDPALPEEIAGLSMVSLVSGDAALNQVSGLHGTDVGLVDAHVAEYQGGAERMTAWVGVAPSPERAGELVRRMTEGIQKGNPMFSHAGTTSIHGVTVHMIESADGPSYYFQSGSDVVWLTVFSSQPQGLLERALEVWH